MAHFHNNALIGASGQGGYQIERSLRFNSADSAYLNRTPASASNRKTWTWSAWVKKSDATTSGTLFAARTAVGATYLTVVMSSAGDFRMESDSETAYPLYKTNALFRDPAAWYHFVIALDMTQATSTNRIKVWVNGVLQTTASYNVPAQNTDLAVNSTETHLIGQQASGNYYSGYLTEVNFIDGQALTPSSFGETDTITGVWQPKRYIHTTSSATSWDYKAYSGTGNPGSWSSMTSVSSGNALGGNSSSGTSNPSVAIFSAGAKSKIFRFTAGAGDSRTINVWSSDDGVTWTSQASTTFSVLGGSGHQTTGQYAVYQFANGDFFSSSSYAVTVNNVNSFYLKFADNSGTTSTTLGKDSSGNGNNFTPNNFSVTAGAGNDSLIDTPTPYADGGNGRGNYATWNAVSSSGMSLTNGNLDAVGNVGTASFGNVKATIVPAGKTYWEFTSTSIHATDDLVGLMRTTVNNASGGSNGIGDTGLDTESVAFRTGAGTIRRNGTTLVTYTAMTANQTGMMAYDPATRKLWVGINGTWFNSGDPGAGTGEVVQLTAGYEYIPAFSQTQRTAYSFNFGQRAFAYTPPSGFLALNTQNLPEPSIKKPSSYFDAKLYTGNGSTQTISGFGFSPDLVWLKGRSTAYNHFLADSVRGISNELVSNDTLAEATYSNKLTALNSDGFSLGSTSTGATINNNGTTYVAWCWDESATPGFDIVTYTGNGGTQNISHTLGVVPSMIIIKDRSAATNWYVYHTSLGTSQALQLSTTNAAFAPSPAGVSAVSSSNFTLGGARGETNTNAENYVAYLWSEVAGFSKFGSYTGNGSTDGPFIFTGFRPRWVMIKCTSTIENWAVKDTARNPTNTNNTQLFANLNAADDVNNTYHMIDFLSNGLKIRGAAQELVNGVGSTYIFAAFAESPFKYSLAR